MCGIAGAVALHEDKPLEAATIRRMLAAIRHRGPEAAGLHAEERVILGHARLSIIDLAGGLQPIPNEDASLWVICNGEVFNYVELMDELKSRGHHFRTASDSETILHLYEDIGVRCLDRFIGQYAFAIWDGRRKELLLARDRLGVRPLFYTVVDGHLLFASEIKALLSDPRVSHELDLQTIDQIFTYWTPLPGRTAFRDIQELPAGTYLKIALGHATNGSSQSYNNLAPIQYWDLDFPADGMHPQMPVSIDNLADELRALLIDATRLRLRADVPVGAYLSGGLDSSTIAALVHNYSHNKLQTFSVTFRNEQFDERGFQQRMAHALGTEHHTIECDDVDIARVFPEVIWHCEVPLLRTGPAPMFMLARLVHEHGFKVILTGEGADEILGGYSIFKEAKVRRWWAAQPLSQIRPALLQRLHGEVAGMSSGSLPFLKSFFGQALEEVDDPAYSHRVRWRNTARQKRFFSDEMRAGCEMPDQLGALAAFADGRIAAWDTLSKGQYLEAKIFMAQYLLSSQGDRVAMAHAIEGRFPFLDHRIVEFAATIPPSLKLRGLNEKYLLKRAMRDLLPAEITTRIKQPYRAPISTSFFGPNTPDWVGEMLNESSLRSAGLFDPGAVNMLIKKCRSTTRISEGENMALVGILSTQLLHHQFQGNWTAQLRVHADYTEPTMVKADDVLVAPA